MPRAIGDPCVTAITSLTWGGGDLVEGLKPVDGYIPDASCSSVGIFWSHINL